MKITIRYRTGFNNWAGVGYNEFATMTKTYDNISGWMFQDGCLRITSEDGSSHAYFPLFSIVHFEVEND